MSTRGYNVEHDAAIKRAKTQTEDIKQECFVIDTNSLNHRKNKLMRDFIIFGRGSLLHVYKINYQSITYIEINSGKYGLSKCEVTWQAPKYQPISDILGDWSKGF